MGTTGRRRRVRRAALGIAAVAALAGAPLAEALLSHTPVLKATANEGIGGVATDSGTGDEFLAYSKSRPNKPHVYDAYLRKTTSTGRTTVKLNPGGRAFAGSIDLPRVVYQQIVQGQSDLKLYNIQTGVRSNPPEGVNTRYWEYAPRMQGDWMLFVRQADRIKRLVLFNTQTRQSRILQSTARWAHGFWTGQIAGTWLTWARCAPKCSAYRLDLNTGTFAKVPQPAVRSATHQYASAVTPSGVVYLTRSGNGCGLNVRIVRFFGPSDPTNGTVIASLPSGRDVNYAHARVNTDGSVDYFYDRGRCVPRLYMDVYKVTDPAP